ncbi:HAD family hydrolase [Paracoccus xiamenensis]|uniref:HAD family hydrolase n=1 Tax=Paracoccus xiamenensis TaxID=2714901 RepID=UPI00140D4C67|nr:HAD family phosphatase [Paracoccus xiamenensis]NHF72355.1 HAD family phosphatase [Paracoccus xiamenensis]
MTAAVIFDLDGVLVDSEPLSLGVLAEEMRAAGIADATADEVGRQFLGVALPVIRAYVAERLGRPVPEAFAERFEDRLLARYPKELRVIPGVPELLDDLTNAGIPIAIATGGSLRRMGETLRVSGLDRWFRGRAFSADQVAMGKPAPDLFLLAARELRVDPADCVVLEDSPHGVTGALRAGARAVGFVGGSHLDSRRAEHVELLRRKGAAPVLDSMTGMFAALTRPA